MAAQASAQDSMPGKAAAATNKGPYGMAGCGLCSIIFGAEEGFLQVFAATTNGTFASQTFGITSGTSNCVARGVVRQSAEQEVFFETNYANIKSDMVSGNGEYLAAVGSLFGCSDEVRVELGTFSQTNYEAIVPNASTTSTQALYSYKLALSQQDSFAKSCTML